MTDQEFKVGDCISFTVFNRRYVTLVDEWAGFRCVHILAPKMDEDGRKGIVFTPSMFMRSRATRVKLDRLKNIRHHPKKEYFKKVLTSGAGPVEPEDEDEG